MKKKVLFMLLLIVSGVVCVNAQVTIGSGIAPTRAALLELKTQQADADNATSTSGGFILPRVTLVNPATLEPFVAVTDPDWTNGTNRAALTKSVIGLLVYNVGTTNGLEQGMLIWKGASWEKVSTEHPWVIPATASAPLLKHATQNDNAIAAVAQVTIGVSEPSMTGSIMQLKEVVNIDDDAANSVKGIGFPRVALSNKDELYPMFQPTSPLYLSKKDSLKKSHTGLIVYNVDEDGEGLAKGLSQWDGKEWVSFQTKMGNARFANVSCADITVNGAYAMGTDVSASNYLTITVNVIKEGSYTIVVKSRRNSTGHLGHGEGNGYSYYLTGVALGIGTQTLTVPCQGKPIYDSEETAAGSGIYYSDDLIIEGLPMTNNVCEHKVQVQKDVAAYSMMCGSAVVVGEYRKGVALNSTNKIQVNINVINPGSYSITGTSTGGIRFAGSGYWATAGTQQVELLGSGTPNTVENIVVDIRANAVDGNAQCSALVQVILPTMTYAIIGNNVWSWNTSARTNSLSNPDNFGPTGTFKFDGLSLLWQSTAQSDAISYLQNGYLSGGQMKKPDIVLFYAYDFNLNTMSAAMANQLRDYVTAGGCLMFGTVDATTIGAVGMANTLMGGIFGSDYSNVCQAQISGNPSNDCTYPIKGIETDPIINGPFGNLANRHWGEDNGSTGTVVVTQLPPNSVQICSAYTPDSKSAQNPDYSVVWYNNSKNFIYFGDSTGASDVYGADASQYPAYYPSNKPGSKSYGDSGGTNRHFVYNAALEFNAICWMVKKAAVSGINPH